MKEYYTTEIIELLKNCDDLSVLDFVLKFLQSN